MKGVYMTIKGKVTGGMVILEKPNALPEGTVVEVQPIGDCELSGIAKVLLRYAGKGKGLPPDLSRNHDHYLHGQVYS
jgi:hypothetical protein